MKDSSDSLSTFLVFLVLCLIGLFIAANSMTGPLIRRGVFTFWTLQAEPTYLLSTTDKGPTCNFSRSKHLQKAEPLYPILSFGKVVECTRMEDTYQVIYYARLDNGTTWVWEYNSMDFYLPVRAAVVVAIIILFIGAVIFIGYMFEYRREQNQRYKEY